MRILVADHDATMVEDAARALSDDFVVDVATSKLNCLAMLDVSEYHVIVAAERLTDGSGLELLSQAGKRWPEVLRVLSIEPDRVHLLAGRLKPFKLFETISYPIDVEKLRNVLLLAQAAEDAHVDTLNVQHIVLEDEVDGAGQEPVAAASGQPAPAPPPQARAAQTRAPAQRAGAAPNPPRRAAPPPASQPTVARSGAPGSGRQAASPSTGRGVTSAPGSRGASAAAASAQGSRGAAAGAPRSPFEEAGQQSDPRRVAPSGRAKLSAAVGFESPAPPLVMPGNRRIGDRRAGSERRGTISVSAEQETFAGAESLAEAAEIAASLRPRLDAPDVFGKRRTMMVVAAGLGLAVVAVAAAMMFSSDDVPPVAANSAAIADPTLQLADAAQPAAQDPQPLALASAPADVSADPPEVAAFVADIESALTVDDFARARGLLDTLREIAPQHPRLAFFTALISRGEEMQAIDGGADPPEPPTLGPAIRTAARKPAVAPVPRATPKADDDVERKRAASLRALASPVADSGAVESRRTASLRALTPAAPDRQVENQRAASLRALAPPAPAAGGSADPRRSASSASPAPASADTRALAASSADTRLRPTGSSGDTRSPPATSPADTRSPTASSADGRLRPAGASADTRLRPASASPPASLAPTRTATPAPASTFSGRTLEESGRSTAPPSGSAQPRTIVLPVVKEARLVRQIDPEYPRDARRDGIEGSIDLRFTVKADGKVADIEVVEASPAATFDREAVAAVRRWRYEPRREDGVPVDSRTRVRLEFRLDQKNGRR